MKRFLRTGSLLLLCAALALARAEEKEARKHPSGLAAAPPSAHGRTNPFGGNPESQQAGKKLFARYCARCHGDDAQGGHKAPPLRSASIEQAAPGDLFWFLTNGNLRAGMPSWSRLPEPQRWQIVSYLKSLRTVPASP